MADRIVVLHDGRVEGDGRPADLYRTPASQFVATFLGDANLIPATLERDESFADLRLRVGTTSLPAGRPQRSGTGLNDPVVAIVRPERVRLGPVDSGLPCEVVETVFLGGRTRLWLRVLDGEITLLVDTADVTAARGDRVGVTWEPEDVTVIPAGEQSTAVEGVVGD